MQKKRKSECECEECPEWIFTFADLVMLMMGFFVILWVLKPAAATAAPGSPEREQWEQTVAGVRDAFGYLPDPGSDDPIDRILLEHRLNPRPWRGPGSGGQTNEPRTGAVGTDERTATIRLSKQVVEGGTLVSVTRTTPPPFDRVGVLGVEASDPAANCRVG